MRTKYVITKSSFLGGWAVVSPGPQCEGETLDSLPEALAWAETHYWTTLERVYEQFTVPEPGAIMEGSEW